MLTRESGQSRFIRYQQMALEYAGLKREKAVDDGSYSSEKHTKTMPLSEGIARMLWNTLPAGLVGYCNYTIIHHRKDLSPLFRTLIGPMYGLMTAGLYGLISDRLITLFQDQYFNLYGDWSLYCLKLDRLTSHSGHYFSERYGFEPHMTTAELVEVVSAGVRRIPRRYGKLRHALMTQLSMNANKNPETQLSELHEVLKKHVHEMVQRVEQATLDAEIAKFGGIGPFIPNDFESLNAVGRERSDSNTSDNSVGALDDGENHASLLKHYKMAMKEDWATWQKHLHATGLCMLGILLFGLALVPSSRVLATTIEAGIWDIPSSGPLISYGFWGSNAVGVMLNVPDWITGELFMARFRRLQFLRNGRTELERLQGKICLGIYGTGVLGALGLLSAMGVLYSLEQHAGISQALVSLLPAVFCDLALLDKIFIEGVGVLASIPFNLAWGVEGGIELSEFLAKCMVKTLPTRCISWMAGGGTPTDTKEMRLKQTAILAASAALCSAPAVAATQSGQPQGNANCPAPTTDTQLGFERDSAVYKLLGVSVLGFIYDMLMTFKSMMANIDHPRCLPSLLMKLCVSILVTALEWAPKLPKAFAMAFAPEFFPPQTNHRAAHQATPLNEYYRYDGSAPVLTYRL